MCEYKFLFFIASEKYASIAFFDLLSHCFLLFQHFKAGLIGPSSPCGTVCGSFI
jgi:hypothetical protein